MPEAGWFVSPQVGNIVWCRFPMRQISQPGPKPRPALVLSVGEANGQPVVVVAYGTSQKIDRLYAGEFVILPSDGEAYTASGLSYPTQFNLRDTFELDYNDIWFGVAPSSPYGQTPKLGVLHPSLMRRAQAAFKSVR
jgi:hypothetical protein